MTGAPLAYDPLAGPYARYRTAQAHVLAELHRGSSQRSLARILEVGCGTGNHLEALVAVANCWGVGVEPSQQMLRLAPCRPDVAYVRGTAGHLPFASAVFDLIFSVDVIHHLPDTFVYFRAAWRALRPGGLLCTFTDSAAIIRLRRPLARYWPETVPVDRARYPPIPLLSEQMATLGFSDIAVVEIEQPFQVTSSAPFRQRAFSCLHLISEPAFWRGLRRLEADLQQGPVAGLSQYACVWGRKA
jgi:SAM-dependent methyltransferase